ncbi:cytochrome c biogenesis protein CcdA [Aneurinibacillus soli]|uniref:Thiol:disulfide interchange protein DsbD n=1 Tax=Aneurinibacillus soli TaxID=1500254 RepID=A0A0U5BDD7_9BACL|nr:cytochrome c biogenesis protein CcdA [Aneurinibacillus soli]PYE62063.1 cytochrome c biogenesis protein CcdA [Aneurinibacillus soli]BAU28749.1 Thiol:disulfide interchange protein DsbD precursor [Aneurinibacillus soli]
MNEVNIGIAFLAGVISFLSPCVFPLVPAYLAQLTGGHVDGQKIAADRSVILTRSLGFILGFTSVFLLLGASSSFIGQWFLAYREWLEKIGGVVIIVFGLQMAGLFSLRILLMEKRLKMPEFSHKGMNFARSMLFGFVFGAGWSPCIGLVLSSILILASQSGTMLTGMMLLFVYSLGLGIPFLIVSLVWSQSLNKIRKINKYLPTIQKVNGWLMVALGIMLYTGSFEIVSTYFSSLLPASF